MNKDEVLKADYKDVKTGIYCIENTLNGKKYIGLSSNIYSRWKDHLRADGSCTAIHGAINKYGADVFEFSILTECPVDNLYDEEIKAIALHGTMFPNGYNLTSGGDGARDVTEHTREIMRGYMLEKWDNPEWREMCIEGMNTPEAKERRSAATKRRYEDEAVREAHSDMLRERWADEEYKEKLKAIQYAMWNGEGSEDRRKKHGERSKESWETMSQESRDRIMFGLTAWRDDPQKLEQQRANLRESLNRPEVKEKRSKAIAKAFECPEKRKVRSGLSSKMWESQEHRDKTSAAIKAAYSKPEMKIKRCFYKRNNGVMPTFEEGWNLVLKKGYGEEWYDFALSYYTEYSKKSATSSSSSTQTAQTNDLPLQS